ncbi:MAG: YggS family pyridoxal phosphate-dependent enzyme [Thermodesulfobacteriota bacterium]
MSTPQDIALNLAEVRREMDEAARAAGRDPADVILVAVTKTCPPEAVAAAHAAGQVHFGESYVQEALPKLAALSRLPLTWHFIGRLQSNKAKYLGGHFSLVHSIDSPKLAQALHKRLAADSAPVQDLLIQANLAGEAQKAGVAEEGLLRLAEDVSGLSTLRLRGLMILPPLGEAERNRRFFAGLRQARDRLEVRLGMELPVLSMGMSDDFAVAIAEGATHVRVGARIFGARPRAGE